MSLPKVDFSKIPSRSSIHKLTDELIHLLFPLDASLSPAHELAHEAEARLRKSLQTILKPIQKQLTLTPEEISHAFFATIPTIYEKLISDAEFFMKSDPAAEGIEEVIIAYPGFYAIT